ncbi:MAG: hypothetical protein DRP92_05675 [Candidatus Neomarinimicrobiota bacterium]|nr:MAG: hypothetical protein DRP92_05675 [Candidatus Neomarinimicrobiota bacterium]
MKVGDILNRYNIASEFAYRDRSEAGKLSETAFVKEIEEKSGFGELEHGEVKGVSVNLSPEEKLALHFLFGVSEPDELTFYGGRVKFDQIAKGNLLDVKG